MLDETSRGRSIFVVTRMGKPQAVILGMDQFENSSREFIERLETMNERKDKSYIASIAEAREDFTVGRTLTSEELDEALSITNETVIAETKRRMTWYLHYATYAFCSRRKFTIN